VKLDVGREPLVVEFAAAEKELLIIINASLSKLIASQLFVSV